MLREWCKALCALGSESWSVSVEWAAFEVEWKKAKDWVAEGPAEITRLFYEAAFTCLSVAVSWRLLCAVELPCRISECVIAIERNTARRLCLVT
jgi:hypothetical protein